MVDDFRRVNVLSTSSLPRLAQKSNQHHYTSLRHPTPFRTSSPHGADSFARRLSATSITTSKTSLRSGAAGRSQDCLFAPISTTPSDRFGTHSRARLFRGFSLTSVPNLQLSATTATIRALGMPRLLARLGGDSTQDLGGRDATGRWPRRRDKCFGLISWTNQADSWSIF